MTSINRQNFNVNKDNRFNLNNIEDKAGVKIETGFFGGIKKLMGMTVKIGGCSLNKSSAKKYLERHFKELGFDDTKALKTAIEESESKTEKIQELFSKLLDETGSPTLNKSEGSPKTKGPRVSSKSKSTTSENGQANDVSLTVSATKESQQPLPPTYSLFLKIGPQTISAEITDKDTPETLAQKVYRQVPEAKRPEDIKIILGNKIINDGDEKDKPLMSHHNVLRARTLHIMLGQLKTSSASDSSLSTGGIVKKNCFILNNNSQVIDISFPNEGLTVEGLKKQIEKGIKTIAVNNIKIERVTQGKPSELTNNQEILQKGEFEKSSINVYVNFVKKTP